MFIFSKARSANSMTSKLFDLNPDFLHFLEPYSAWRERRAAERSLVADVDFLERLVDCKLASEEVYSVVTQVWPPAPSRGPPFLSKGPPFPMPRSQGAAVPQGLRTQRLSSTVAAEQLSGLCANRHIAVKTVRQASLSAICELRRRLTRRGDEVRGGRQGSSGLLSARARPLMPSLPCSCTLWTRTGTPGR